MKPTCEVVVLPKGRGGTVCRMSADAYINRVMPQDAVCPRSVLWLLMTGPTGVIAKGRSPSAGFPGDPL